MENKSMGRKIEKYLWRGHFTDTSINLNNYYSIKDLYLYLQLSFTFTSTDFLSVESTWL